MYLYVKILLLDFDWHFHRIRNSRCYSDVFKKTMTGCREDRVNDMII